MSRNQTQPTVIMLTTTHIPYVHHIPPILSCPNGIPYRFRYHNELLHDQILKSESDKLYLYNGILYIRDNESELKLCYPLRRFKILWKDDRKVASFFYLKMGDLIKYREVGRESQNASHGMNNDISWENVQKEYSEKAKQAKPLPCLSTIVIPAKGEPPILTDQQLRNAKSYVTNTKYSNGLGSLAKEDKYMWLDTREIFSWPGKISGDADNENDKWSVLMSALSLINTLSNMCFWRILRLSELRNEKKTFRPTRIAKSDKSGFYTHGYEIDVDKTCSVRILQIIPKVFMKKSFEGRQFDINVEYSDPNIKPVLGREIIDGTYDEFEVSFGFRREASGKVCLLRVICTQPQPESSEIGTDSTASLNCTPIRGERKEDIAPTIPPTILPIRVVVPIKYKVFFGLSLVFACLAVLGGTILRAIFGSSLGEEWVVALQGVMFLLALLLFSLAGRSDLYIRTLFSR